MPSCRKQPGVTFVVISEKTFSQNVYMAARGVCAKDCGTKGAFELLTFATSARARTFPQNACRYGVFPRYAELAIRSFRFVSEPEPGLRRASFASNVTLVACGDVARFAKIGATSITVSGAIII